jgi:hypothetical protein
MPDPEIQFILFSHYYLEEDKDFEDHRKGIAPPFRGVEALERFLPMLRDLLCGRAKKGILVLFYSHGWTKALRQLQRGGFLDQEAREAIDFGPIFAAALRAKLRERGFGDLSHRLRIVTAKNLLDFFSGTQWDIAKNLDEWLVGESVKLSYDSPKLVDAVVRLRAIDSGVPVFRVDQDVLFNRVTAGPEAPDLAEAVAKSVQVYRTLRDHPGINHTMFSCRYNANAVRGNAGQFEEWSTAFATRVFPALLARPVWGNKRPSAAFHRGLAQRFYGLNDAHDIQQYGLWRIGAHPLRAVVSGALLYLSPGAILDLPPFSNFNLQVMWVDDHLKYLLHRALGHFGNLPEDPWGGQRPEVYKERPSQQRDCDYIFGEYIPTVFWGSLLEAWIQENPHVKLSREEIGRLFGPEEEPPAGNPGPLTESLLDALRSGHMEMRARAHLYRSLHQTAIERIRGIHREWSALREPRNRVSCACEWVCGTAGRQRQSGLAAGMLKKGGVLRGTEDDVNQLNDSVREGLDRLILQAMSYIDWTLNWPKVVQTIRSIPPSHFVGDIEAPPEPAGRRV